MTKFNYRIVQHLPDLEDQKYQSSSPCEIENKFSILYEEGVHAMWMRIRGIDVVETQFCRQTQLTVCAFL